MKKAFYMDSIAKKKRILLDIVIYCFLEFGNGDSPVGVECTRGRKNDKRAIFISDNSKIV